MITIQQAIRLKYGMVIHSTVWVDSKKRCMPFRINGKVKLWKTKPEAFRVPLKHGLWTYDYLTEKNATSWHLPDDCQKSQQLKLNLK